jgi:hypothetical protein
MFIEAADFTINTSFIAYVRYFTDPHTDEHRCMIYLQNGHQIEVSSYEEVRHVRESLRDSGAVIMAIDEPPDEYGDIG